jgi:hypothetical protein
MLALSVVEVILRAGLSADVLLTYEYNEMSSAE